MRLQNTIAFLSVGGADEAAQGIALVVRLAPVLARNWLVVATVTGRGNLHAHRIVQELLGDAPDLRRHGGGEEQRLAGEWHQLADALDVGNEAHVEHAVGLVDHQELDTGEQQSSALEVIEQTARSGDQHVDAARELGILIIERYAADHQYDDELLAGAILLEAFLPAQPSRRVGSRNRRTRHSGAGASAFQQGEHRQGEGGGLPVPVWAMPSTSRRPSTWGIACSWVGVGTM